MSGKPKAAARGRFVGAGHIRPDRGWAMRPHSHPFHEIIAPVRGSMRVLIKGQTVTARAGDLLIYQAGTVHEERSDPDDPVETYFVAFEHPAFDAPLPVRLRDERGRVPLMISWLSQDGHPATERQRSAVQSMLEAAVAETLRLTAEGAVDRLVRRTRDFVRAHLAEKLTLDDLAGHAGMSKYHFVRAYRRAAGRTPMKDVQLLRAEFARGLILTTDTPLKAVAPLAGLGDEYRMSRVFRRQLGFPPGALRSRPRALPGVRDAK